MYTVQRVCVWVVYVLEMNEGVGMQGVSLGINICSCVHEVHKQTYNMNRSTQMGLIQVI